jgi:trans-aconitate methyltransferase
MQHFDQLYADDPDPWGYRSRWYERRRFALVSALLERQTYDRAFDPACSNGALTSLLSSRCAELVAFDGSAVAVQLAQKSLRSSAHVQIQQGLVPQDWPAGTFDLIVLTDFLYYLTPADIERVALRSVQTLRTEGTIIAGHWKGTAYDFLTPGGEAAHQVLSEIFGQPNGSHFTDPDQIISTWSF